MQINRPEVLAEITAVFERYEGALLNNEVGVLNELFWDSPLTVRYGFAENLYGQDMIRAFRASQPQGRFQREILRRVITTYGTDFATADIEFMRQGSTRPGRQSQTWARFSEGWRVVSAHVSFSE